MLERKIYLMLLDFDIEQNTLKVAIKGDFCRFDDEVQKEKIYAAAPKAKQILISAQDLNVWDSTALVFFYELAQIAQKNSAQLKFSNIPDNLKHMLDLALKVDRKPSRDDARAFDFLFALGNWAVGLYQSAARAMAFVSQTVTSFGRFFRGKAVMRSVDFLFALEDCSYKAIGIMSLVSFMIGLILAFVGAVQLKTFGAQIYVASLVAIGMTRIMGAIMAGVIMSGRTGASYAATIGTMQVNEEIDALKTMGIPTMDFLVLPRILSLMITMPLLTLWADLMGMFGGAFVSVVMLDISPQEYWKYSLDALNFSNFMVGIFHGFVFGIIIALCGCYYGINCGRNADSVGVATTKAVVSAIVLMIVATGIITMSLEVFGI